MVYKITKNGAENIRLEIKFLNKKRKIISERIGEAIEQGDISENAEYHAAKEEQGLLEARLNVLKGKLSDAHEIDIELLPKDKIYFGSTALLMNEDTEKEVTLQLVSDEEVDVPNGRISVNSPIGEALINKIKGEIIIVSAPKGEITFKILDIV